ncbi:MAG: ATP-binding protein [Treponema sp.]|nr:ATP-binding protein [Treponema sp.]
MSDSEVRKFDVTKKESINSVQDFVSEWCENNGVSMKSITKLSVCIDEIASNIIFYSGATFFSVECKDNGDDISIRFSDDGKEFDPLTQAKEPDIALSLEEREIGGLGIFMVKKMMKSVSYARNGNLNELTMITEKSSS